MEKKGELTSKQIITILILIVSFVVILAFFFSLNLGSEIDKESCRNSVILKGSALGKTTSLQCKTQDVCLTSDNDCEQKGKDTVVLKIDNKQEILDEVSELLYDCWWQMGEGKIDYSPSGAGLSESYCAICNTIKIDDSIKNREDLKNIEMKELYLYLQSKKIPNSEISYLYYLMKVNSMESVRSAIIERTSSEGNAVDIYTQNLDLDNPLGFAIITGVTKQGWGATLIGAGVGALAGITIVGTGGLATIPLVIGLSAVAGGGGAGYLLSSGDSNYLSPMIYPFDGEVISRLECKEFSTLS